MTNAAAHIEAIVSDGEAKLAAVKAAMPTCVKRPGARFPSIDRMAIAAVSGTESAIKAEVLAQIKHLADSGDAAARGYLQGIGAIPLTDDETQDFQ